MHVIRLASPAPGLREYLRCYAHREVRIGEAAVVHPMSARAFPLMEFHTAGRRAPLSPPAAAHGIVFFAWLGIFPQARLVATRHVALHRQLGILAAFVAAIMVPLAYKTSISMVRRGFDLSGDLRIEHNPAYEVIFPLKN